VRICIDTAAAERLELVEGGLTDWTQQLLGNRARSTGIAP
jgi:hypothetical protein